ncbi:hypothetical protein TVAG_295530 [Trichomonas vaginalis G3]|uniref:Uncharacterized protein n=1 Tax=Trichomonas vaginalis (strain ATCC PRA-98 / G3) TaxID=412133 RepID=A2F220_TRIV3|nr:hypothetical protein TVAGG3_0971450 [Trichomonas vaginalis G3]EAY01019.1 hypothetical protein TVAG_295530 [Trichomonas vaginalis G3]KAI5488614.1 hypothetical protein TVAGG3_0971450 [Trichomonas vaginalis G3]|eukprot:XP_001313905.1 hypothetical protein [Trichomonas vaginalis G3]
MNLDPAWEKKILADVANLRVVLAQKADKSAVEQINRYQNEITNLRITNATRLDLSNKNPDDPEVICQMCIDNDDMETAFLTILKHIETLSSTKAEVKAVEKKASKKYVEGLFERLNSINRQQIQDANAHLRDTLEAKLNRLNNAFDDFTRKVSNHIDDCHSRCEQLEVFVQHAKEVTQRRNDTPKNSSNNTPTKSPHIVKRMSSQFARPSTHVGISTKQKDSMLVVFSSI